jgi:hypothetical protein
MATIMDTPWPGLEAFAPSVKLETRDCDVIKNMVVKLKTFKD